MTHRRITAGLISLTLALVIGGAAEAQTFTPYNEWRQEFGSIDAAVASMSSSDMHGTFNRISALLQRGRVSDLLIGEANGELLPQNWESGMLSALVDLQLDIKAHFFNPDHPLSLAEQYAIIQVIDVAVVVRINELYDGYPGQLCVPSPETPCTIPAPDVIRQLGHVVASLRTQINDLFTEYNASNTPVEDLVTSVNAANYTATVDRLRDSFGRATGVEEIQYE